VNCNFSVFKSKGSWEIFIKDSNYASSVISYESVTFFCVWVIKFNSKIKIWFPFFVINNWNFKFELSLLWSDGMDLVLMCVILYCYCSHRNSSNTECDFSMFLLFYYSYFNSSVTLSHGVMKTFESNVFIFISNLVLTRFDLTF